MKSPQFWMTTPPTLRARLLKPLGELLARYTTHRRRREGGYKSSLAVICCGNLTLGGTGKTPTALWLAEALQNLGYHPGFLTRGWGGERRGPHLVDRTKDTFATVGDEALLHAQIAPTVVARNRGQGAKLLEGITYPNTEARVNVIIMDDGYQNPTVQKDASLLIFDRTMGVGNGLPFPAGPLRETLSKGLDNATALLIVGDPSLPVHPSLAPYAADPSVFYAQIKLIDSLHDPNNNAQIDAQNFPYVAFAGIGLPEKFFHALRCQGLVLAATMPYPDHHRYTPKDLQYLTQLALDHQATLVTTTKDYVRLPAAFASHVKPLPAKLEMAPTNDQKLLELLLPHIRRNQAKH